MKHIFLSLLCALSLSFQASAQELSALARVDPGPSTIEDGWFGKTKLTLHLSQGVPFRVFALADPARLVVDFREVDFSGVTQSDLLAEPGRIGALRFGSFRPGWSRLVAELSEPMLPEEIAMPVGRDDGRAALEITLKSVDQAAFEARAGTPADPAWAPQALRPRAPAPGPERFIVVIDPGHGGIDPGAQNGETLEKDLMLTFARLLEDSLRRRGVETVLTRDEDVFVALETRVAIAHQVGGDVFVSLHADNLSQGGAKGATIYTLSDEASDAASAHLAARHNRSDIIAGVDLTGADDQVAGVLLDLARQETEPRSTALAAALAEGMAAAGGPMNRRPLRRAGFSVLKSADIPSALIEVGFMSSQRDLANLRDPVWRLGMVEGIANAIEAWRDADAERRALLRQ